jgi:UDP-N-acetylglucosamine/UDP-N-acetyl-alpha-D-glucosaminouronate 4-epimerase
MRCLVTGGAGFIGSHLIDRLLAEGHAVRTLDNFSTGARSNLLHISKDVEIVEGDLRSFERVATAVQGCELVFHQAALPSVPRSVQDPLTSNAVNVIGTLNVLLASRNAGVRRVIYASSSSVYGAISAEVKREDDFIAPLSPYGVAKYAGEAYCSSFFQVYGLETVSLRYFNIFGPRQSPLSQYAAVIPNFFVAAMLGEAPTIYGDGKQARDFTFVGNACQANLRAAAVAEASGQVFNVACGEKTSINQLAEAIAEITGHSDSPLHAEARAGDIRISVADINKARSMLAYEPTVGLRDGLERTYEHLRADDSMIPKVREHRQWVALAS